jgi:hypothetical protein
LNTVWHSSHGTWKTSPVSGLVLLNPWDTAWRPFNRATVANKLPALIAGARDRGALRFVWAEVTDKSQTWGFQLGSVYIRKVHFRDVGMIHQIEEKVVNRLRQVTSAIRQAGSNQVSVITSSAER